MLRNILYSDQTRSLHKEIPFFRAFGSFFTLTPVLHERVPDDVLDSGRSSGSYLGADTSPCIFIANKKSSAPNDADTIRSLSDGDIMNGLHGLLDDRFETHLLMNIDI